MKGGNENQVPPEMRVQPWISRRGVTLHFCFSLVGS